MRELDDVMQSSWEQSCSVHLTKKADAAAASIFCLFRVDAFANL